MSVLDKYEAVIGLEVHAQLMTASKMFCRCPNQYGSQTNSNICPVCTGQPGSLPVINKRAVELGMRAALALHCDLHEESVFARKNYFYPDLPKGYQISQFEKPFSTGGYLNVPLEGGEIKKIGLTRIHFEEDAGKSVHGADGTHVNLNRAGVPLVEIVSEPDMRTSHEGGQYLRTLRTLLQYAGVCDGNMEEGNFRCDANVSVRPKGQKELNTRVELKNINSFRYVEKAIDYEIKRQVEVVESGGEIHQQTRTWNSIKNVSDVMRQKEEAHDYRYFPEPDLPPLIISAKWQKVVAEQMPELPEQMRERLSNGYGLSDYEADVLISSKTLAAYFEEVAQGSKNNKLSANWVLNELLGSLNTAGKVIEDSPVSAANLAVLINKIQTSEISGKMAKTVFEAMFESGQAPDAIIKAKGLSQISDSSQLQAVVDKVIESNPDQVAKYKGGKTKLLGFFVGQVMKETRGQANPGLVNQIVKKSLDG